MESKKLIKIITTSWNETENIDRFILWYRTLIPNCDITILDNESDPEYFSYLKEVSKKHNISLGTFKTNNKMAEEVLTNIRNTYWKKYKDSYYYVLIVDLDELVTINEEDLIQGLKEDWDYCKFQGYNVIAEILASPSKIYSKPVLFKCDNISETNLAAGSHTANPINKNGNGAKKTENEKFKLYHFKWANVDKGLLRNNQIANKGRTEYSIQKGWNYHHGLNISEHMEYCIKLLNKSKYEPNKTLIWFYEILLKNKINQQ